MLMTFQCIASPTPASLLVDIGAAGSFISARFLNVVVSLKSLPRVASPWPMGQWLPSQACVVSVYVWVAIVTLSRFILLN